MVTGGRISRRCGEHLNDQEGRWSPPGKCAERGGNCGRGHFFSAKCGQQLHLRTDYAALREMPIHLAFDFSDFASESEAIWCSGVADEITGQRTLKPV